MFVFDPIKAIERDGERVAAVAAGGVTAAVPGCPGWTVRELVRHLGTVQRFWAAAVRAGGAEPAEPADPEPADLAGWYRAAVADLADALRAVPAETPCWTWWGDPATVGAVARHQVQEAAVHRWDAESAVGSPGPIDADVAADGVGEFLSIMLGREADNLPGAVELAAVDTGGIWAAGPGLIGARVRATASELVLLLYRRIPAGAVDIAGDRALVDALLAAADTE